MKSCDRNTIVFCAILIVNILFSPTLAFSDLLGITFFGDELIRIDETTGTATLIGSTSSSMRAFGLAGYNNRLFTFDQNADVVVEINPFTGSTIATYDIGLSRDIVGEGAIAFKSDGTGYLSENNSVQGRYLYEFNITSGTSSPIGTILTPTMDGLDFNSMDKLYGLISGGGAIYTIDETSATTTLVGTTLITGGLLSGLTFNSDDDLYFISRDLLYTYDLQDLSTSLVGDITESGFSGVSGITFLFEPIPEALSGFDYPYDPDNYEPWNLGYRFLGEGAPSPDIHPGSDWNVTGDNDGTDPKPVYAVANGRIVVALGGMGYPWYGVIIIEHDYNGNTVYSQYGHVTPLTGIPNMQPGDGNPPVPVRKGQPIGTIYPYYPSGAHLHFEIRNSDHEDPTDPEEWFGNSNYFTGELRWKIFLYYEEPRSFIMSHGDYSENQIQPIVIDSSKTFDMNGSPMAEIDEKGQLTISVDGTDYVRYNFFKAWNIEEFNKGILGIGENRGFGGNYHWAETTNAGVATSIGDWYFRVLEPGYYKVEANIPKGPVLGIIPSTTEKAKYQIYHNDEVDYSHTINQYIVLDDLLNKRWKLLGSWYFTPESLSRISLSNNTGEVGENIGFDAIRVSPLTECNNITPGDPIYPHYGSPYNVLYDPNELMVNALCASSEVAVEVGNGNDLQYIYHQGWIWRDGEWVPYPLLGDYLPGYTPQYWYVGNARASITLEPSELIYPQYLVAYVCTWTGTEWKCGCRDQLCLDRYWQLQIFGQPSSTSTSMTSMAESGVAEAQISSIPPPPPPPPEISNESQSDELAMDIGTFGLWHLEGATWTPIAWAVDVDDLERWGNGLVIDSGTQGPTGLWLYDPAGWSPITMENVDGMEAWASGLAIDRGANGLWNVDDQFNWSVIAYGLNVDGMARWGSGLAVDLGSSGLFYYPGWTPITNENVDGCAEWSGGLAIDRGANGLWNHNGSNWTQLNPANPEGITKWGAGLVADFGGGGLHYFDGSNWTVIANEDVDGMVEWEDGLVIDRGSAGLWNFDWPNQWTPIAMMDVDSCEAVDLY